MPFKTLIKASSITNLTDARFFSSFQVNWLGFNFNPLSPYTITADQAQEMVHWLAGPSIIGEFGNRSNEEIQFFTEKLKLRGIQVPAEMNVDFFKNKIAIFKELQAAPDAIPLAIPQGDLDEYIVLNISGINNINEVNKNLKTFIKDLCEEHQVLLSLTFEIEDINEVLEEYKPAGLNIYGSEEIQTGVKAFDEIADLLEQLEI